MSSETITRNDLENILNEVLPSTSEGYTTVSNSLTQSTATGQKTFAIPITIPDGYSFLSINRVATSYAECLINGFGWNGASNNVEVSIRNTYSGTLNCKVEVEVLCYKLNGILPSKAVDYIVEQGTSGIWTYRKWNSGKYEATINTQFSLNSGNSWTGGYWHKTTYGAPLPSFALTWSVVSAVKTDDILAWYVGAKEESDGLHFYWVNGTSGTVSGTQFGYAEITIRGTWK